MSHEFQFKRGKHRESLAYPKQFVRLEKDKALVGIDKENFIELNLSLGRLILFLMHLRNKEGSLPLSRLKSETFKRLTLLSNCHRVMLFLFGFKIPELLEQVSGSEIIDNHFTRGLGMKPAGYENISDEVFKYNKSDFPLALNFFSNNYFDQKFYASHSVMVLGILPNGKILCFQKNGIGNDREMGLTTLDKIHEANHVNIPKNPEIIYSLLDNQEAEQAYENFLQGKI